MGCRFGKVAFTTKSAARKAAKQQRSRANTNGKRLNVYWCPKCQGYHLTKKPKGDWY